MKNILVFLVIVGIYSPVAAQVSINEICASNGDIKYDPVFFNFSGWIELYNAGTTTANVGGYYLSDNAVKTKWMIPAGTSIPSKSYLLIWCDEQNGGLHTNFSLDTDGETITLSSSTQSSVDVITYPKQVLNLSYGRSTDGASTWSTLKVPSPSASNTATAAQTQLADVSFSVASGRYDGSISLSLSHDVPTATIRFTTDGSEPTMASQKYTTALSVSTTTTIKAKAFDDQSLPSDTEAKTYFVNEHPFSLPVVSLSTKPSYLWDDIYGIYTNGTNGALGNCQNTPMNWNQDWDRHASFEYFDVQGNRLFDQDVDIRIGGACSRANPQKSFAVKARNEYGKGSLNYHFFPSKTFGDFGGVFLRNSGNDFNMATMRDALLQTLSVSQLDVDYMAYQPSILYLNGQYWGIQGLREKIDGDYIESNYGIKKSDIDLLETWGNAIEGTPDAFTNYKNTLLQMNSSDPATFEYINKNLDVQEYINYLTTEIYVANTDWPGNNQKFWRQRSTNGKFRWIFWDLDFGFGCYTDWSYYNHPTLQFATDPNSGVGWPNPSWATEHIRTVLQNPTFRTKFIQTLTTAISTTFKPERVIRYIDSFHESLKMEMPYHQQKWGYWYDWETEVQRLRNFAIQRNAFMIQHTADFFGLGERVKLNASVTPANTGTFKLNGVTADEALVDGTYFKGLPYTIEPVAATGYVFKNWKVTKQTTASNTDIAKGALWSYLDQGADAPVDWTAPSFNDAAWASGEAQLGYGGDGEKTTVSYGGDAANKYITTYFRKSFTVNDTTSMASAVGSVLFDDGVVVYLNGTEIYRGNMPEGTITGSTLAATTIPVEGVFNGFVIDKHLFNPGVNAIAVEVHQASPGSSDISFDFELKTTFAGGMEVTTIDKKVLTDTAYSDVRFEAIYETATAAEGIVINEISASKSDTKDEHGEKEDWIELYNGGNKSVDVAGMFVTDDTHKAKYQIPKGSPKTILTPGSFLLFWADDQTNQGITHVNFKISNDGETLGLFQVVGNDTLTVDQVTFGKQDDNTSYSRIPNGSGPFLTTAMLTPWNVNMFVTATEENVSTFSVYPNPAADRIYVKSQQPECTIQIVDLTGSLVKSQAGHEGENEISIADLHPGLFVVYVAGGGKRQVAKIIKR